MELSLFPGEEITRIVKVRNDYVEPTRIRVTATDWYLDTYGRVCYTEAGSMERSCADWLIVNPQEVEIPPLETFDVRVTAYMPEDAAGSYWACLLFETVPEPDSGMIGVASQARLISYIYLTCVGTEVERGELANFIAEEIDGHTILKLTFENTGNVHLRPFGKIRIEHGGGTPLVEEFDMPHSLILPQSSKIYSVGVGRLKGLCTARAVLDYGTVVFAERIFLAGD